MICDLCKMKCCPCGGVILADTEEWKVPRCHACSTEDDLTDHWRCTACGLRPYACRCKEPEWTDHIIMISGEQVDIRDCEIGDG